MGLSPGEFSPGGVISGYQKMQRRGWCDHITDRLSFVRYLYISRKTVTSSNVHNSRAIALASHHVVKFVT